MKILLIELAVGKHKVSPSDEKIVEEIRTDLRIVCKHAGHGPGLPDTGDVVQAFEVRLIQALIRAFGDADSHMSGWWPKGAWLGCPTRRRLRTVVSDRKLKWSKIEPVDKLHQGWQINCSSLEEH